MGNRDLFRDSGTASVELKTNVICWFCCAASLLLFLTLRNTAFLLPIIFILLLNLFVSRRLLSFFYETKGFIFALLAACYYSAVYPFAVGAGSLAGILGYFFSPGREGV